jgi:hypothetical protein
MPEKWSGSPSIGWPRSRVSCFFLRGIRPTPLRADSFPDESAFRVKSTHWLGDMCKLWEGIWLPFGFLASRGWFFPGESRCSGLGGAYGFSLNASLHSSSSLPDSFGVRSEPRSRWHRVSFRKSSTRSPRRGPTRSGFEHRFHAPFGALRELPEGLEHWRHLNNAKSLWRITHCWATVARQCGAPASSLT